MHSQHGKKSSLNANVAAKLFHEFPDVHMIAHGHIFPGVLVKTELDFSPGTEVIHLSTSVHISGRCSGGIETHEEHKNIGVGEPRYLFLQ